MKKLKTIIIIIFVIIVVLITSLIIVKNISKENQQKMATPEVEEERIFEQSEKMTRVEYTFLTRIANTYIQSLNMKDTRYMRVNEDGDYFIQEDKLKNNIIGLLSEEYIKNNNINIGNLHNYVDLLDEQLLVVPINMKGISTGNVKTYVVQGIALNFEYELKKEFNIIVNMDYNNRTFSIEPTLEKYEEINTASKISEIKENENKNNRYSTTGVNVENIVKDYINNLKRMMLVKPELVYDRLDVEYKNKRFGTLDKFKEYVEKNVEEIRSIYIDKYLVNTFEDYSQYIGTDKYNNMYIFNEKDPLNYTVLLDTYTINSDKFKKTYDEADNKYRVKMNIDKWIKMINNRDYETAYKCLDETFRNNNFASEEEFEKYMREKFPLHYKLSVGSTEEVNGLYKQRIILEDITGLSDEKIENTIIMQLKDNYEFVMSFGIE